MYNSYSKGYFFTSLSAKLTALVQLPKVFDVQVGVIFCDIVHINWFYKLNNSGVGTMKRWSALCRKGIFILSKYP